MWKQKGNIMLYLSAVLTLGGWLISFFDGETFPYSVMCYAAAILIGGRELLVAGIKNMCHFVFDMDTLVSVAVIGAAAIGRWQEGAVVVLLFAVSEAMERYSADQARQSIKSLMKLAPKETLIRRAEKEITVPVEKVQIGDIMIVTPGRKIAMDGIVVKGMSTLDQSAITGESLPAVKTIGDGVFAGTLNGEGVLEVSVTKSAGDTTLARIIQLVEESQTRKAFSQTYVDRFAAFYTPAAIMIAVAVALFPPLLNGAEWNTWIYRGLALLIVGCPCALVISTPVAIVTAIGNAARNGVIIKGGAYLEAAAALDVVAFDKTGTLTRGFPEVTDMIIYHGNRRNILTACAALERRSQHPLASAIVRRAEKEGVSVQQVAVEDFQSITGRGVRARVNGKIYTAGSPRFFEDISVSISRDIHRHISDLQVQGKTVMIFGTDKEILALIAASDKLRDSAEHVIQQLHEAGIGRTVMLTGDNKATAEAAGKKAGVSEIRAELLPEDKLTLIKRWQAQHRKIAMVGDGVNDAPALAESTVGIAMGSAGNDTALETADIVLMSDDLTKLPYTMTLSRRTLMVIKQNVALSLIIKMISFLMIFPGWLTLWLAVFADVGATLIVTANSMRLTRIKS